MRRACVFYLLPSSPSLIRTRSLYPSRAGNDKEITRKYRCNTYIALFFFFFERDYPFANANFKIQSSRDTLQYSVISVCELNFDIDDTICNKLNSREIQVKSFEKLFRRRDVRHREEYKLSHGDPLNRIKSRTVMPRRDTAVSVLHKRACVQQMFCDVVRQNM